MLKQKNDNHRRVLGQLAPFQGVCPKCQWMTIAGKEPQPSLALRAHFSRKHPKEFHAQVAQ